MAKPTRKLIKSQPSSGSWIRDLEALLGMGATMVDAATVLRLLGMVYKLQLELAIEKAKNGDLAEVPDLGHRGCNENVEWTIKIRRKRNAKR